MEVATKLVSSPSYLCRTHFKQSPPPHSPSALKLYEHSAPAPTSMLTVSLPQHFPTSVLIQEQRYDNKSVLHIMEERTSQATLDRRAETELSRKEENDNFDGDLYLKEFQSQFLRLPGLRSGSLHAGEELSLSLAMQSVIAEQERLMNAEIHNVVALAKKALSASREAATLTKDCKTFVTNIDESIAQSSGSTFFSERPFETVKTVRSTRLLERQSKKRKIPNSVIITPETKTVGPKRITSKTSHPNDMIRQFMAPETTQLLTAKEESKLIIQLKDLRFLEKIKSRLHVEFGREPTMVEWAEAIGVNCNALQSRINCGKRSGEKLVYANIRLVVHMAKRYQNNGLSLQDLVQEGNVGLLKGVVKYNPQSGCRFATYAYWWIKQAIKIAIYQKSRTVRLPVSVYTLMYKVSEAKRKCAQEGNHEPTKEQIAMHAGISVEKLQKLQVAVRRPISMQQCVWTDQATTFQEITSDPVVESPKRSVEKKFMRNHVRNLLNFLPPMERKVITLRFGIGRGYSETLAGIGAMVGLSDERIRRFEMQGLTKLKQLMSSQGLDAYADLLF